jgi:hypothetical protein
VEANNTVRKLMCHERADVILIRPCRAIIMQNFVGALVADGTMAVFGLFNPRLAAFIRVGLVISL